MARKVTQAALRKRKAMSRKLKQQLQNRDEFNRLVSWPPPKLSTYCRQLMGYV